MAYFIGDEKTKKGGPIIDIAGYELMKMIRIPECSQPGVTVGPSTPAPRNPPHYPTYESHRPLRPDAPVFNPDAADVPVLHGGRLLLRTILNSPPPSPPRAAERHLDF
jgi:hypothetical protein